jgi:uncharacterized protein
MDGRNTDLVYNMSQLLKEPVGSTRKLSLETSQLALDEPSEAVAPDVTLLKANHVHGGVKVTRLQDGVLVQGDVEARVTVECSRCLTEFAVPVEGTLEEQFLPTVDVYTGFPVERPSLEEYDQAFQIDANHLMDLGEPVRQALLVAMPMKPLCREDCAGICLVCGANRNEVDCGHADDVEDTRWSGLRELRIEDFPVGENSNN